MSFMRSSEVIIVGSGITGAALGYELANLGIKVLLLEQFPNAPSATRYSYGGIAYWAGMTELTRSLCSESLAIHRQLSEWTELSTEFRELPLLGTIDRDQDPIAVLKTFQNFTAAPQLLTPQEAHEIERLLNPDAIAAAVMMPYAHINPIQTAAAYLQAMERLGGQIVYDAVLRVIPEVGGVQVVGQRETYQSDRAIVCAGGAARALLQDSGIPLRQYFSHAESIETDIYPELQMQTVVMPAEIRRFELEQSAALDDTAWLQISNPETPQKTELLPPILDCGALQFADGSFRFGQISRTQASLTSQASAIESEQWIRNQLSQILPQVAVIPGQWVTCPVAFSGDLLPLVGSVEKTGRLQVLSGFSNPMALVPATARRFAKQLVSAQDDKLLEALLPSRFV
jgi:glycine/D-amino acid oxidase-like deaminating enzyme